MTAGARLFNAKTHARAIFFPRLKEQNE